MHGKRAKHNLQPDHRLPEEELSQGWVAANTGCEHIAVDLEIHETFTEGKRVIVANAITTCTINSVWLTAMPYI